ncbi:MAG TPA: PAS domain-containing sensor histidine kinase [Caulobacteraceae bacterium]|nr:PAS domain-containing sensor histidine kinase [Caulobacteraceae bacterium]
MESDRALPYPPTIGLARGWLVRLDSAAVIGLGYAVSGVLTAAAIGLGSSPSLSGPLGPASELVTSLLWADLILMMGLGALIVRRTLRLVSLRADDPGARLHLRFVGLFAAAAVVPALIIALFFGVLVTRGVESWFKANVETTVETSAKVAVSYLEEQRNNIGRHTAVLAHDIDEAGPTQLGSPVAFSQFLSQQADDNGFSAAYLIDGRGRVLASSLGGAGGPPFLAPSAQAFSVADEGDIEAQPFEQSDLFRGLYRLRAFHDAYLYVVWPVDPGVFTHLRNASVSIGAYQQARAARDQIRLGFFFSYLDVVIWVLLAAVSVAMSAASSIAGPVARLVQAAGKVAAGDLSVRVDSRSDPEEIAVLSRAFNRMTSDLEAQQRQLLTAHKEAESGRQFVETVLFGVSAGVIGLDQQGRVSVANRQAAALLELPPVWLFRPLRELVPEFDEIVERAGRTGQEFEEDVDVARGGELRRLRVRIGHNRDGLVLTFDDITRLVAAQRNAAWKDVARRIAHEIKNPLTPIQLSAERLRRKYRKEVTADVETFDRCTETIIRQVGDIGRMVDEFSAFARMPAPRFATHDAVELLRQAVFAQRVADPGVQIELVEPDGPVTLVCDERMVGQALTNLLKNAGEAIAARRKLSPEPGRITARLLVDAGRLAFEIEDNGVGLPAKNRDRLTEPYVTTREKGTGLGLAIVDRIVEEHGGELLLADARTLPGARITLRLPLTPHPPIDAPHAAAPEPKDA